jgi:hypothetical protein
MSWDLMVVRPADDMAFLPLGPLEELRERITASLPRTEWVSPRQGYLTTEKYSIEFGLDSTHRETDIIWLHVRGEGDPFPAITRLCKPNGWAALDCSTGDFLDLDEPSREGWEDFQEIRRTPLDLSLPREIESPRQGNERAAEDPPPRQRETGNG